MNIGIIDADLVGAPSHRFPNLVSMKLAGFHTNNADNVELLLNYNNVDDFDRVYISKVFTQTPLPFWISERIKNNDARIIAGGTGFYFDKAPPLDYQIEHSRPYYKLYDAFLYSFKDYKTSTALKFYRDYSIGFLTRHCFRRCPFCVNRNYTRVVTASPLAEFYDDNRKKICLLDDNFFGFGGWESLLDELKETKKPFVFRQGLDERLLSEKRARALFSSRYDGDFIFAFDSVKDYDLIAEKLKIINRYRPKNNIKFYVLTGFESTDLKDIENTFARIELLFNNGCLPYIMRYRNERGEPWKTSRYSGIYQALARWINQPSFCKKQSFREYTETDNKNVKSDCASVRALRLIESEAPHLKRYLDIRFKKFLQAVKK